MGYTRPQEFRPGKFLRTCDTCGIRYRNTDLVRGEDGFWRCKQYCVEMPAITRDKISALSQQRREAPLPPHGIPFDTRETYAQERQVFDFIVNGGFPGMTGGANVNTQWQVNSGALAFTGSNFAHGPILPSSSNWRYTGYLEVSRYLYSIIVENQRPASWISAAKTLLTALANNVLANQFGPPAVSQANAFYGFINVGVADNLRTSAQVGLALCMLYAYKANGDPRHLAGALASATYLRNVQAIGALSAANFTSSDAGGTVRLYTGGLISLATFNSGNQHVFDSLTLPALELWYGLIQAAGDQLVGCTGTGGIFTSSPQQLLSQCIADLRAFVAVGAFDVFSGTTLTGWSATTPREKFNAYPTGTGSWEYADGNASAGTAISGSNIALALRTLYAYEGYSSQVSSIWTWLMGFSSNTGFQCPSGTLATDYACASTTLAANPTAPPAGSGNVVAPAYDPTLALTTLLTVKGTGSNTNGSSLYDWTTTGMLAPIASSQNATAFRKAKTKMSTPVLRMPVTFSDTANGPFLDYPMLRGVSGLAMQLNFGDLGNAMYWNTIAAARCGGAFRYQPQAFTGANPPALQPGVSAG
jgi:hypothetical protein